MIKKAVKKILEIGIILAVTGIGIAGIIQNNSANGSYESYKKKEQNLSYIYKNKNDSLYQEYLNQKEFLSEKYFGESDANNIKDYFTWGFKIKK